MADPLIQTFCCRPPDRGSDPSLSVTLEFDSASYSTICLISSIFGIFGSVYQVLPRKEISLTHRWCSQTASRGRSIIVWLAFADLLASLGVFMRSVLKLSGVIMMRDNYTDLSVVYCALFAAWIQYFYTVTWLWTLCYAVDMFLILKERQGNQSIYHFMCWLIPAILTITGLAILYLPNADCNNLGPGESPFVRILPNYVMVYLPMVTVMVINPVLYMLSSQTVHELVCQRFSQFTRKERTVVDTFKVKFGIINIVFYLCWLPNLVNGVTLWTQWYSLPRETMYALWYFMALMNPLQALFNSLVYRRANEQITLCHIFRSSESVHEMDETTPLISSLNGS